MASSIQIRDANGNDKSKDSMFDEFVTTFVNRFSSKSPIASADAAAKTSYMDNLFVLGYTISETNTPQASFNPASVNSGNKTPDFFVPRSFACTLTGQDGAVGNTLNICMLTKRAKRPPNFTEDDPGHTINASDYTAGIFLQINLSRTRRQTQTRFS